MTAVPAETPVTMPPDEMVATDVLLVLQKPPPAASAKVVLVPTHAVSIPVMEGDVPTVTIAVARPPGKE